MVLFLSSVAEGYAQIPATLRAVGTLSLVPRYAQLGGYAQRAATLRAVRG
jgi:hypothetical protein